MFLIIDRKKTLIAFFILLFGMLALWVIWEGTTNEEDSTSSARKNEPRTIHLVTGEFSSTTKDGKKIEAYRWDPGTIYVKLGETVHLSIRGINGESHPFIIEGTGIQGEVRKNEETIVPFTPKKEGIYRLICLTHGDAEHNGPMIGYIVVD